MFKIGDLLVDKISGPVSFTYLVPSLEAMEKQAKKGIILPMVILIGDEHHEEKNKCEPCEEEKGCYTIGSDTLLNQIDELAERYTVDFYIEHAKGKGVNKVGVMANFVNKTLSCYDSEKKALSCDFKNIRWHYADARFWKGSIENMASEATDYLAKGEASLSFKKCNNQFFINFMELLQKSLKNDESFDELSRRLSTLLEENIMYNNNSLVYKQLSKYNIGINVALYCTYSLKYHGVSSDKKVYEDFDQPMIINSLCEYMKTGRRPHDIDFRDEYYRITIKKIYFLWVRYTSCFLDLYFLGRMFKPSLQSHVTLAFFGHSHIKSIVGFLVQDTSWYDIRYRREYIKQDRCIHLTEDVDFDKDLEDYMEQRASL